MTRITDNFNNYMVHKFVIGISSLLSKITNHSMIIILLSIYNDYKTFHKQCEIHLVHLMHK